MLTAACHIQGAQSHAIWHAWAGMEASQGDSTVVRYLYRRGLEANPRSRFTYLSWGLFEKQQGSLENARALLKQGHLLNPRDAAILQVGLSLNNQNTLLTPANQSEMLKQLLLPLLCSAAAHGVIANNIAYIEFT